jgi:ESS family glutamate:Na+ symporter
MTLWDVAFTPRAFFFDAAIVSFLLLAATLIRGFVPVFQKYLIPNSLIAGFLGLLAGPELLGWLGFGTERMGVYVYHLLALTFIGVGLQRRTKSRSRAALHLGFIQILSMLLQALVGLVVALLVVHLLSPTLVPAVGMLLPLGFAMGPGIAYSIGEGWGAYGFDGGGSIGLTIAAIGFLVAYGMGMVIVNRGIRAGRAVHVAPGSLASDSSRTGYVDVASEQEVGARLTFRSEAIEPLSFHVALVAAVYLLGYLAAKGIEVVLVSAGAASEVPTLWSFHFLVTNVVALAVRAVLDRTGAARVVDDGFVQRLTGLMADYLIAVSIMAISLSVAWDYALPILAMCAVGVTVTYLVNRWATERIFRGNYPFERFTGMFSQMTGNLSSGLAMIRVTDPRYQTPVAQDQVMSSGVALMLGFPLFIVINLPFTVFGGALHGYWAVVGMLAAYMLVLVAAWWWIGLRDAR